MPPRSGFELFPLTFQFVDQLSRENGQKGRFPLTLLSLSFYGFHASLRVRSSRDAVKTRDLLFASMCLETTPEKPVIRQAPGNTERR